MLLLVGILSIILHIMIKDYSQSKNNDIAIIAKNYDDFANNFPNRESLVYPLNKEKELNN